ncbi:unnamed protein product [Oikopleura dioica]|uniref:Uncharacterized protein n=1 Tax=Oikopleura dioica TaxID=34765 RepID=E4Y9B3_OIKDI|nr:unnamed protein product [Oikopleura dioica]
MVLFGDAANRRCSGSHEIKPHNCLFETIKMMSLIRLLLIKKLLKSLREQELMEDVSTLKSGEYVRKTPDTVIECAMRHIDFHYEIDALQEIIEESW